ncbi:hypothetical protein B0T24DRAFT_690906 [Lasiosphaeria ovina]|uniref:Clr5 domain-containing protein n=1 Tax=Lasiosphaeria ovina TaxID=92902 RepID=A0AAE0JUK3_9PEZI|nr:hypothetical protein B0T24DRAFT_690906 [Lasiosphaeria ovina]
MASQAPPGPVHNPQIGSIPHDQRWPLLKDTIIHLFMEENLTIPQLAAKMKQDHGFDAQPTHYRYRFKQWGVRKRMVKKEKDEIIMRHAKRAREAASTSSLAIVHGEFAKEMTETRKKQLKRYIGDQIRHKPEPDLASGIFMRWSLPYAAVLSNAGIPLDHPSPFGQAGASPGFIIDSPHSAESPLSPPTAASPTTRMIQGKAKLDRADLFIEGRHKELLARLSPDDRRLTVSWLHDLWMFSFMTVKYWGRGPETWTQDLIAAKSLSQSPPTPGAILPSVAFPSSTIPDESIQAPSQLCRWTIHYMQPVSYDRIKSPSPPPRQEGQVQDIEDETTWATWNEQAGLRSPPGAIQGALSTNSFSAIESQSLPMAVSSITLALERSEEELHAESFAMAIIARNHKCINDLLEEPKFSTAEGAAALRTLYPLHLSVAHLDGAKTCCLIIDTLAVSLQDEVSISANYRNDLGHIVLDSLMITILRSHTSVTPATVSEGFESQSRFPGEEVDICGRWDADTPCVRQLYASGRVTIPFSWKHVFCHTSAQAVCHSITAIFSLPWSLDVNTRSGLFVKSCGGCRQKLELGPLHTLVLEETLFGAIACLTCLLAHNADPTTPSEISIPALFSPPDEANECSHRLLTPLELAKEITIQVVNDLPSPARLGWSLFVEILGFAQLGILWAAVQTEVATYRRLEEGDNWVSDHFDMQALVNGLQDGEPSIRAPLYNKKMMNNFSDCGWFGGRIAYAEFICSTYFMKWGIGIEHALLHSP